MKKRNRQPLLELMRRHRVETVLTAELIRKSTRTISDYRCKSGNDISDNDLELLGYKLRHIYPISQISPPAGAHDVSGSK